MANLEFRNACCEVLEILKYVKEDDLEKIPSEEIQILKNNINYEYKVEYNPNKSIKEQNISKLAKGIIATYFTKYIATNEQKDIIAKKRTLDLRNYEKMRREQSATTIFNQKEMTKNDQKTEMKAGTKDDAMLVKYEKEKWYIKILRVFKIKIKHNWRKVK